MASALRAEDRAIEAVKAEEGAALGPGAHDGSGGGLGGVASPPLLLPSDPSPHGGAGGLFVQQVFGQYGGGAPDAHAPRPADLDPQHAAALALQQHQQQEQQQEQQQQQQLQQSLYDASAAALLAAAPVGIPQFGVTLPMQSSSGPGGAGDDELMGEAAGSDSGGAASSGGAPAYARDQQPGGGRPGAKGKK
jgi:hypothetical protein